MLYIPAPKIHMSMKIGFFRKFVESRSKAMKIVTFKVKNYVFKSFSNNNTQFCGRTENRSTCPRKQIHPSKIEIHLN
jgi:hypothetical protein